MLSTSNNVIESITKARYLIIIFGTLNEGCLEPMLHFSVLFHLWSWRSFHPLQIHGHCSQEIREIILVTLRRVRTTRSSTHSLPFQASLPNPRNLSLKSSFIPRTCNIWKVLPSSCFPESYILPSFKSKINKLDLIPISS